VHHPLRIAQRPLQLTNVFAEALRRVDQPVVGIAQMLEMQRAFCVAWNSGARMVNTLRPTIALSISAVVLMPMTAALCTMEWK
jgi:hypothetical protein